MITTSGKIMVVKEYAGNVSNASMGKFGIWNEDAANEYMQ